MHVICVNIFDPCTECRATSCGETCVRDVIHADVIGIDLRHSCEMVAVRLGSESMSLIPNQKQSPQQCHDRAIPMCFANSGVGLQFRSAASVVKLVRVTGVIFLADLACFYRIPPHADLLAYLPPTAQ